MGETHSGAMIDREDKNKARKALGGETETTTWVKTGAPRTSRRGRIAGIARRGRARRHGGRSVNETGLGAKAVHRSPARLKV